MIVRFHYSRSVHEKFQQAHRDRRMHLLVAARLRNGHDFTLKNTALHFSHQ